VGNAPLLQFEFLLMEGGQTRILPFPPSPFVIGSGADCQLRLSTFAVEPRHAEVVVTGSNKVVLTDLSEGKTWVNGMAVQTTELSPGAMVRVGRAELMLRPPRQTPLPTPVSVEPTLHRATPLGVPTAAADLIEPEPASLLAAPARSDQLAVGSVIGERYEVTARLAAGGMGEVYKARHVELGKSMAVKVMRPELSADPAFVARFKREAIATGGIGQMNIVDISDFGRTADGRFYFVMEYLDGQTLSHVLQHHGPLATERVLHIGVQVARALVAAHSLGVVHRDLKPENIMLLQRPGHSDFVKVLDFGVAKLPNPEGGRAFTVMGMVVGTPQYMSPEQARAVNVDHRSDIYALGLILHEMLSGKPTFEAETPTSLMVKQVTEAPPPLVVEADGSVELAELVMQMLAKSPDDRPQSMEQVLVALDELSAGRRPGQPVRAVSARQTLPPGAPVPNHAPTAFDELEAAVLPSSRRWVVGAVVALALLGTGGWFALSPGEVPAATPGATPVDPGAAPQPLAVERPANPQPAAAEPAAQKPAVEKPAPEPPSAPKPGLKPRDAMHSLRVQTNPPGAEVYEGQVRLGIAPLTLTRSTGALAELRLVHEGCEPVTRRLTFGKEEEVTVVLPKVPPVRTTPVRPTLVDPYSSEPMKKADPKPPELKEGVY
jgi:hypothetical protein